jgi:hypothetical protein
MELVSQLVTYYLAGWLDSKLVIYLWIPWDAAYKASYLEDPYPADFNQWTTQFLKRVISVRSTS